MCNLSRTTAGTAAILAFAMGGTACVSPGQTSGETEKGYGLNFYEPFDNSRDWGPGYLAGPPHTTIQYDNNHGRGTDQGPLVHTDTNRSAPSIPDATRSDYQPVPASPAAAPNPSDAPP